MTEETHDAGILTREELDALLATLAEERDAQGAGARPFRAEPGTAGARAPHPVLHRAFEAFAREQGRHMSNVYQARIEYRLLGWQELTASDAAATMLPSDRVALFEMQPSGTAGFVWFGRPLLFALLSLGFGARPGTSRFPCPQRAYTGIEHRVYRRAAEEALQQLDRCWGESLEIRTRVLGIEAPGRLAAEAAHEVLLGSFDVSGLGEICRLRVGVPRSAFEGLRAQAPAAAPVRRQAVAQTLTEMPLDLRVELGSVDVSLSDLSALQAGSVIPIEGAEDGSLLVRVEGRPKFRAIRGTVGRRLAVQLTQRLEKPREGSDGGRG